MKRKVKTKSKIRSNFESYKSRQQSVYLKAYRSGWNDCEKNSGFGSSLIASNGYGAGYKARKRSYRAFDRLQQAENKEVFLIK